MIAIVSVIYLYLTFVCRCTTYCICLQVNNTNSLIVISLINTFSVLAIIPYTLHMKVSMAKNFSILILFPFFLLHVMNFFQWEVGPAGNQVCIEVWLIIKSWPCWRDKKFVKKLSHTLQKNGLCRFGREPPDLSTAFSSLSPSSPSRSLPGAF